MLYHNNSRMAFADEKLSGNQCLQLCHGTERSGMNTGSSVTVATGRISRPSYVTKTFAKEVMESGRGEFTQ